MTDKEVMQMALDALEWCYDVTEWPANGESTQDKAIEALRARLSQCDRCGEVNPAEIHTCSPNYVDRRQWKYDPMTGKKLWQGLTDKEIEDCLEMSIHGTCRAIEAKLKEKNERPA